VTTLIARTLTALGALALVLGALLLLDGSDRTVGFRLAIAVLAAVALRLVATVTADANPPPPDSPFARGRGNRRRRLRWGWWRTPARRTPADTVVLGGIAQAGTFHTRLRPALRQAADERLRAHHGIGVDHPAARDLLGSQAWELLRPDRPAPEDRRAPGPDEATMEAVLTAIEGL
jgi:hypothetical protein